MKGMRAVVTGKIRDQRDAEGSAFLDRASRYIAKHGGVCVLEYRHEDGCPSIAAGDLSVCTCDPLDVALCVPDKGH